MSRSSHEAEHPTANDRFKSGFANWFWAGLVLATLGHAALFVVAPTFGFDDLAFAPDELTTVELPEEIEIPPPPEAVARPAAPVVVDDAVLENDDLTIPPTTFDSHPVENLPPPPSQGRGDEQALAEAPRFTPMTVAPTLRNGAEIAQALVKHYPPLLRDSGIGGTVVVWFFIDERGRVLKTQVHTSSGFDAFDQAALQVADQMEFTPAMNRDKRVPVWVSLPITFETQ